MFIYRSNALPRRKVMKFIHLDTENVHSLPADEI